MTVSTQPALDADMGGTNARFALADTSLAAPLLKDSIREFVVADFPSLGDAARHYLEQIGAEARRGVFAVAGRVGGDEARDLVRAAHMVRVIERNRGGVARRGDPFGVGC